MITLKKELSREEVMLLEAYLETQEISHWILEQKEPRDPFYLFGYFQTEVEGEEAFDGLLEKVKGLSEAYGFEILEDQDWKEAYKFHLKYRSFGPLHWIPLWEKDERAIPETGGYVYLDSGMAFGTGAHESTRLIAQRIVDFLNTRPDLSSCRVLDAGCGSGILALSARALGFAEIDAFDFDPESVRIANEHNTFNAHLKPVGFHTAAVPDALSPGSADLLLVNIQTNVLVPNAETILQTVAPGGALALSGILATEIDEIKQAYTTAAKAQGRSIKCWDSREEGQWADAWMIY